MDKENDLTDETAFQLLNSIKQKLEEIEKRLTSRAEHDRGRTGGTAEEVSCQSL